MLQVASLNVTFLVTLHGLLQDLLPFMSQKSLTNRASFCLLKQHTVARLELHASGSAIRIRCSICCDTAYKTLNVHH